jgi:hypothetical protein
MSICRGLLLAASALACPACEKTWSAPAIVVNEFKATGDGEWLELANNGDTAVDLGEFAVTDTDKDTGTAKLGHAMRFPKGTSIGPHGYILIRTGLEGHDPGPYPAANCIASVEVPCFYAGFSVNSLGGDSVYLLSPDDDVVGETPYPAALSPGVGETTCRLPDGWGDFSVCPATPGAKNDACVLQLVSEIKLSTLLPDQADTWEASGVMLNSKLYVVFDNTTSIAKVEKDLSAATLAAVDDTAGAQYEGIAFGNKHFYVAREGDATILQLSSTLASPAVQTTDLQFADANKGIEGIACFTVDDESCRLLALCEANGCGNDAPGNGIVKVLRQDGAAWFTEATLHVPSVAYFADYSDIALSALPERRALVAIVSQESSALWLGTVAQDPWRFVDGGRLYTLPRAADGSAQYCNIEGVTFLSSNSAETLFAMVSDKSSDASCSAKSESIHLFQLP